MGFSICRRHGGRGIVIISKNLFSKIEKSDPANVVEVTIYQGGAECSLFICASEKEEFEKLIESRFDDNLFVSIDANDEAKAGRIFSKTKTICRGCFDDYLLSTNLS